MRLLHKVKNRLSGWMQRAFPISLRELRQQETELRQLRAVVDQLLKRHHYALALPPEALRLHVGSRTTMANFLAQGANSSAHAIEVFGEEPEGPILDWGCGSGRTLRWLWEFPLWRAHYRGCDVDREAIAWLQAQNVQNVAACDPEPPLPYGGQSLSGVFAFSVLTHIHPSKHRDWYSEIRRILRPGSQAYLTTHGSRIAGVLTRDQAAEFRKDGFAYVEHEGHYKDAAIVSENFTRNALDGILELVEYRESGYQNMDAFRLVRR